MAGSLTQDKIKNVFQKIIFYLGDKLYHTSSDNNNDVLVTSVNNDISFGGTLTGASFDAKEDNITRTDSTSTTSSTTVATATSVKAAYDRAWEPIKGGDDNYVTDAQLTHIGNLDAGNTTSCSGDQTLPHDFVSAASGGAFGGAVTMGSGDKLQFVDANEYISGDGTDLTIGSGDKVNVVATDIYMNLSGNFHIDADGGEARLTNDSNPGNVFVPADNADITTKKYVDDSRAWQIVIGGYKTNNNSDTNYYFQYRPDNSLWNNYDSSPSTITSEDVTAAHFTAPEDCTVTQMDILGVCTDTGATDPFKFYIKKATVENNYTSFSTTDVGNTLTITPGGAGRIYKSSTAFSGASAGLSAGDSLYIFLKKDSTTANQDNHFHITLSGHY